MRKVIRKFTGMVFLLIIVQSAVGNQTMNDNSFRTLTDERVLEAERLKKAWFEHVLNSLEQLGRDVDKISSDLNNAKEGLYKEISEVKELLHKEIKARRLETDKDLDKLEERIEKLLDGLARSIKSLTVHGVKEELTKDINKLENKITAIRTQIAVVASIISFVSLGIVVAFVKWILPVIVKMVSP